MEYGLWPKIPSAMSYDVAVLILVLMEYGLWPVARRGDSEYFE